MTIEKRSFNSGLAATVYTEEYGDGQRWCMVIFQDLPGTYAAELTAPGEFWETHEEEIFGMLQTARLGEEKGYTKKGIRILSGCLSETPQ